MKLIILFLILFFTSHWAHSSTKLEPAKASTTRIVPADILCYGDQEPLGVLIFAFDKNASKVSEGHIVHAVHAYKAVIDGTIEKEKDFVAQAKFSWPHLGSPIGGHKYTEVVWQAAVDLPENTSDEPSFLVRIRTTRKKMGQKIAIMGYGAIKTPLSREAFAYRYRCAIQGYVKYYTKPRKPKK